MLPLQEALTVPSRLPTSETRFSSACWAMRCVSRREMLCIVARTRDVGVVSRLRISMSVLI